MSLSQRIADRRQTDIAPLRERREGERRTPRWIARRIEREFRGEPGMSVQDYTYDVLKEAA